MKNKINIIAIVTIFLGIIIDQVSKYLIDVKLALYESIEVIPNFFAITYYRNNGAAWSMLEGQQLFFIIITIIALLAMIYYYFKINNKDWGQKLALSLMISGTIGNFIDRCLFQYVRDFLDFIILGYDFPIFNVADSLLVVGVFLMAILVFIEEKREGRLWM